MAWLPKLGLASCAAFHELPQGALAGHVENPVVGSTGKECMYPAS